MHPRNPYNISPDFSNLADFFPSLKSYLSLSPSGRQTIDFGNPAAQRTLTQALLKRDFNLILALPEHRLCPPVPNRLNYVLWIQDILSPFTESKTVNEDIRGLDIGTGASVIYPLLACSLPGSSRWSFVATEIDPLSINFASRNVENNNLASRISIWPVTLQPSNIQKTVERSGENSSYPPILAPLLEDPESSFDFTMCNPPFYGSRSEIESSADGKEFPPTAVCTGAETEMITPGGETAFVLQMLRESAREDVRRRCRWFTSMLGKHSSLGEVVGELRKFDIDNYALTQFIQGTTRRWAVGWSFGEERLPDSIARPSSSSLSLHCPAPTTLLQTFSIMLPRRDSAVQHSVQENVKLTLIEVLKSIGGITIHNVPEKLKNLDQPGRWKIEIDASENTWSRAARRKRKRSTSPSTGRVGKAPRPSSTPSRDERTVTIDVPAKVALRCRISVLPPVSYLSRKELEASSVTLEAQWMRGKDRALYEGFWSHVCRKVRDKFVVAAEGEPGDNTLPNF